MRSLSLPFAFIPPTPHSSASHLLSPHLYSRLSNSQRRYPILPRLRRPITLSSPTPTTQPPPSPSPCPSKPSLPPSSQSALISSYILISAAIALPFLLSLHDSITNSTPPLSNFTAVYSTHFKVILYTLSFGALHSGLASVRAFAVQYIGERLFRILFALTSIPSAVALIAYFIAHRYDGSQLWTLQGLPFIHTTVYSLTVLSFLLLYPATFNLLEVAAVQKPSFRMYETGVTRITRHPQLWGQVLWCIAHCLWIGSSFTLTASLCLVAHHCFGAFNGDRRLRDRYGEGWIQMEERTSLLPFAAVARGEQRLKLTEFLRPAYLGVIAFILATYAAHPHVLRLVGELDI